MYSVVGFLTSSSTGGFIVSPISWKSFGFPHGTFWNVFTVRHHSSLWAFAASSFTAALWLLDKSRPALQMIAIIPQSGTNDDNREDPQITRVLLPRRPDHDWESLVDLSGRSTQSLLYSTLMMLQTLLWVNCGSWWSMVMVVEMVVMWYDGDGDF